LKVGNTEDINNEIPGFSERPLSSDSKKARRSNYMGELRSYVRKYLHYKLSTQLNVPRMQVPWSRMKAEDIINWPSEVEFISIEKMNFNGLKKLHELAVEDKLDFSPEFFRRRGVQSSKII